jgi:hypothetical protein
MERARLVAEQQSSGKTQIAWCEEHGISTKTFRRWVLGMKEREVYSNCAADWLEVNAGNASSDVCHVSGETIEVSAGLYTVRVRPGFDRVMFSDICGILGEIC